MTSKVFLEALAFYLNIQYAVKIIFITKLTFPKYTKVDEVYRKLLNMIILSEQHWDKLCEFLEKKLDLAT